MGSAITWYDVLGVLPGASAGQIRDAYQHYSFTATMKNLPGVR